MKTIKSVYKIGNGPSSSHTVGPYHAAQIFGARYPQADAYRVTLTLQKHASLSDDALVTFVQKFPGITLEKIDSQK